MAEMISAIPRGGVQTPKIGLVDRWTLWWRHRDLLHQLKGEMFYSTTSMSHAVRTLSFD